MTIIEKHGCNLEYDEDSVVKQIIDSGIFIDTRRKICAWTMITKKHPKTQLYYKSYAARRREEARHLVNYLIMSHPFCIWCLYWEFFIFWVYLFMYITIALPPPHISASTLYVNLFSIKMFGDLILLVDIIHLFFIGYYDAEQSRTVMKPSEVAKHYLMTYFLIDVLSSLPSYLYCMKLCIPHETYDTLHPYLIWTRTLGMLRVLRIGRWMSTLELFRQYMNYSSYLFKAIKAVLLYLVMMFVLYGSMTLVLNNVAVFRSSDKIKRFFSAILTILVVSPGDSLPNETQTVTIAAIFLCIGYILQLFLYAQVLQVWNKFASARNKNENLLRQFKEYMRYKGLPGNLREKIFTYFNFKFQNKFFNEAEINYMVSDILKQEILVHITKKHIENAPLFKHFPEPVLMAIISHLKSVIYLPDDVIMNAGKHGSNMYFIYYGTVAVYTSMGTELCHLEDGDNFGEMSLVFNESSVATVVAITPCELYKLKRGDFLAVLEQYPELKDHVLAESRDRLMKYRTEYY